MSIVYLLRNPLKKDILDRSIPFYVGYSSDESLSRPSKHLYYAKIGNDMGNRHKFNTINKILSNGLEPIIDIIFVGDDADAREIEDLLIQEYGKAVEGGILTNIADGGKGGSWASNIRWENATEEDKMDQSEKLRAGFLNKFNNDEEFRNRMIEQATANSRTKEARERASKLYLHPKDPIKYNEGRKKAAEKNKGKKRERKTCPHCGKENVAVNVLSSWHGVGKCIPT